MSIDELLGLHPGNSADAELARQTGAAAQRLDELVEDLRRGAGWAATDLSRYASGHRQVRHVSLGILQSMGAEIILAARISDLYERVQSLCLSCRRAGTVPGRDQHPSTVRRHRLPPAPWPGPRRQRPEPPLGLPATAAEPPAPPSAAIGT